LSIQETIWIDDIDPQDGYLTNQEDLKRYWNLDGEMTLENKSLVIKKGNITRLKLYEPNQPDFSNDIKLNAIFTPQTPSYQISLTLQNYEGKFEISIKDNTAELFVDGASHESKSFKLSNNQIKVEFYYFDGDLSCKINNEILFKLPIVKKFRDAKFNTSQHIAIDVQNGPVAVSNISIKRDIYYKVSSGHNFYDMTPFYVPKECYVMIGDNVTYSHDSRGWKLCTIDIPEKGKVIFESQSRDVDGKGNTVIVDKHGNKYVINGYANYDSSEGYPFVHEKYIVGKALFIWWPAKRGLTLIR
ncbi:MAG: hypothetical protein HY606_09030, partial [Planctomycetes bacterium]|nr:hypothetical protein [Planctomycetota bacterium]